jgi:hypothetical protein
LGGNIGVGAIGWSHVRLTIVLLRWWVITLGSAVVLLRWWEIGLRSTVVLLRWWEITLRSAIVLLGWGVIILRSTIVLLGWGTVLGLLRSSIVRLRWGSIVLLLGSTVVWLLIIWWWNIWVHLLTVVNSIIIRFRGFVDKWLFVDVPGASVVVFGCSFFIAVPTSPSFITTMIDLLWD